MNRLPNWLPLFFVVLTLSLSQVGCAILGGGTKTPPVFGTWDFTMDSPSQGTMSGTMTLQQEEDGSYSGRISVAEVGIDDAVDFETFEIDGPVFSLHASVAGNAFKLNGTVDGDTITGTNDVTGVGVFSFKATRVPAE